MELIQQASHSVDRRAMANDILSKLESSIIDILKVSQGDWRDEAQVRQIISLIEVLRSSGRISNQQYVFFASYLISNIHERRWLEGLYETQLSPIKTRMDEVESIYMSEDGEWLNDEEPAEYTLLETEYSEILDAKFITTLKEFNLIELAELKLENEDEYESLRERGRRRVFHSDELEEIVRDIIVRYEKDAQKSAGAQAYFSAIISLGASMEGIFLLECLRSKNEALDAVKYLQRSNKISRKPGNDLTKWSLDVLIKVCDEKEWIKPVRTSIAEYDSAKLAHLVRDLRNYVHPGKQAIDRPWLEPDKQEYENAELIYFLIKKSLDLNSDAIQSSESDANDKKQSL